MPMGGMPFMPPRGMPGMPMPGMPGMPAMAPGPPRPISAPFVPAGSPPPLSAKLPALTVVQPEAPEPVEELPEWLPPNARQPVTLFVGLLPREKHVSDTQMRALLQICGPVTKWDRRKGTEGKELDLGFVTYQRSAQSLTRRMFLSFVCLGSKLKGSGREEFVGSL